MKVVQFAKAIEPLMLPYVESLIEQKHHHLQRVAVLISGSGTNLQVKTIEGYMWSSRFS